LKKKLENIVFIGLGKMGLPMSKRLIESGYEIYGYDLNKTSLKKFSKNGGKPKNDIKHIASYSNIFILMLPNGKIVKRVVNEILEFRKSKYLPTFIDMSSSNPLSTLEIFNKLKNKLYLIDAPVSGGVKKAINGKLSIMVSGNKKIINKNLPILKIMGSNIVETGSLGSAHAMKAINNYVSATGLMAAIEALIIGKSFGIDQKTVNKVLNVSSGKNNATENKINQFVISKKFSSGFSLELMEKDINIAKNLSKNLNLNAKGLNFAANYWSNAKKNLQKGSDHTKIFDYINEISTKKK